MIWEDKVKVWELYYLQEAPIEAIRRVVGQDDITPSWATVKRVIDGFPLLSQSQVETLSNTLQARWSELQGLTEAVHHEPEDNLASIPGVGREKAKLGKMAGVGSRQYRESRRPPQILVGRDVLELAATFKDELSRISTLDDAVWQLLGAPWLSSERPEKASVLHVSHYPELKIVLVIEHDHPSQFLLLMERLEGVSPGFEKDFREWEHQSLMPFIRRCQEITREIWYQTESNEWGLKMGVDDGYGYMINVPLFIYKFALEHCAEGAPPVPELELPPVDLGRFPSVPPHYHQLTRQGDLEFILAVGLPQAMNSCGLFTIELCKQYAQDKRIRKIIEEEKKLKKQTEPFRKTLSEFLTFFSGIGVQ